MSLMIKGERIFDRIKSADQKFSEVFKDLSPTCVLSQNDAKIRSPQSRCKQCAGQGILLNLEGIYTRAVLCECVQKCTACFGLCRMQVDGVSKSCREPSPVRVVSVVNEAKIPMKYARATLDGFTNYTGNGRDVIHEIRQWLQAFNPKKSKGILLSGPVGVGKTFILAAIAKYLAMRAVSVRFVDFFQLLSELKSAYTHDQSDESVLAPLLHCDVLVIDELGKGRSTDWELTILDHLIMGRYNLNKTIVASTNYAVKSSSTNSSTASSKAGASIFNIDLELSKESRSGNSNSNFASEEFGPLEQRVGKRIYSRLFEMVEFIEVQGQDYRKLHKPESTRSPSSPP